MSRPIVTGLFVRPRLGQSRGEQSRGDQPRDGRSQDGRWRGARAAFLGALAIATLAGGCTANGPIPMDGFSSAQGPTLAFESIDGPPPAVFDRLVRTLDGEARARNLPIVSRQGAASYRARGYLSAQVRRGQTSIVWVWDIYDASQQRAARISGEEPAGKTGGDAWAGANDQILRAIAASCLSGVAGVMNGAAPNEPSQPGTRGPVVASVGGAPSGAGFDGRDLDGGTLAAGRGPSPTGETLAFVAR